MNAEKRQRPRSVLVAEDDRGIRTLLELILRGDDCSVIAASDGAEALQLARLHDIDLLLVDVNMPRLDGTAVCRAYRERGGEAPVVLLSASVDGADAARDCAADGFIAKPFQLATILDAVNRYVGAR
ncbi:MAG TPA: response regulator [Chloroflexota bacterium]|nr:response regulator [Chloroflexota bacterium]